MKHIYILLIILIFISCSSAPMSKNTQNNPVIVPEDFFGMVHAGMSATEEEFKVINDMNIIWLLYTFYWSGTEREKGVFRFSGNDKFVEKALQEGKKVAVTLGYSSSWISEEVGNGHYIPQKFIPDFLDYVEALVSRYKGKVSAWQIWNEPNFNHFWKGTNEEFYNLSKAAAQRIRETDPDAYIVGGGFMRSPNAFIKGMHKAGAMENLNALSFHPYALNPKWSMRVYDNFSKVLSKINFQGDVSISEIGYPSGGWYPHKVSMKNLPSHVVKIMTGAAVRGAKNVLWYQFKDHYNLNKAPNKIDSEHFFGLIYPDYTRKNGSWAYQLCARFLPGSRYLKDLPIRENIPSCIASFYFVNEKTGINTLIIWNSVNLKQKIKVTASAALTIHNISTGENSILQDESFIEITGTPVILTWESAAVPKISKK